MAATLVIRPPHDGDAHILADLATQLGYPVGADELRERLAVVAANHHAAIFVASDPNDRPIGWIHVELKRTLVAPPTAQVMGLVVDEGARNSGVGRDLLVAAEEWAAARGCRHMLVGTRVTRDGAHRFYTREGYTLQKTSHFFEKPL